MNNHVVCLKWGNKYPAEYVNRLYAMVKRNLTLPFQFHCMTESVDGINPEINILPLETSDLVGWWYKLHIFKKDFYGLQGQLLFIDLDMVILENMDEFFTYSPKHFCIMQNFNGTKTYGSCIMRFDIGSYAFVWENFVTASEEIINKLHGDQDWIFEQIPDAVFWPKHWVKSFKAHCKTRMKNKFISRLIHRIMHFTQPNEAIMPPDAKIIAFHGKPDPQDIMDTHYKIYEHGKWRRYKKASWIKKYWCE